ncbi:MAG: hypothetical protein R2867_24725 [Caldilineaceae bacterium]
MRITAISTEAYRWPRHKQLPTPSIPILTPVSGLVKIETDEGVVGIGLGGAVVRSSAPP